jgi:hypothetical protein
MRPSAAANSIPQSLAYHEAGHAVAQAAAGDRDCYALAWPDGTGGCEPGEQFWQRLGYGADALRHRLIVTLAGPWAEARKSKRNVTVVLVTSGAGD